MTADSVSVIVATYEWPEALHVVLSALLEQRGSPFDLVIADDGSGAATSEVVSLWKREFGNRLVHVWQPDAGFRRTRILNQAAMRAQGDFLIFIDGDCVPRRQFVQSVRRAALPGWFLASKRLNLSAGLSDRVTRQELPIWRWSVYRWLRSPGELLGGDREVQSIGLLIPVRDRRRPWRSRQPEFTPPFGGYGSLFGVRRRDFERVNGFDMRFEGWGAEDADIALRLRRLGIRCGWPGPQSTLLHLWHPQRRGTTSSNLPLLQETERSDRVEAVVGLRELAAERARTEAS